MGTTARWGLRWPASGDTPSGHTQIKNLAEDCDLFARDDEGLHSARPAASNALKGMTYYETDTKILYRCMGLSLGWVEVTLTELIAAYLGLSSGGVVRRGAVHIDGTETRTNLAMGYLATPDRVQNIVLPTDGLICVAYQALWSTQLANMAAAAIFLNGNQLTGTNPTGGAPATQAVQNIITGVDCALTTFAGGLWTSAPASVNATEATTGQVIGPGLTQIGAGGGVPGLGGPCYIFAAAGTYDVGVLFQTDATHAVQVKKRHLWVWTMGF